MRNPIVIVTIANYRSSGRDLATWHRSAEKLNCFLSPKNQLSDDGQRFFHRETGTKGVDDDDGVDDEDDDDDEEDDDDTFDDVGNRCKDD